MVAACNKTPIAATQSALKRLKAVDVKVSGLILNRFRAHSVSGYYYSSYYYRGYYGETQKPVLESA
jgi:Mrp family chromosome partitioning ATPase